MASYDLVRCCLERNELELESTLTRELKYLLNLDRMNVHSQHAYPSSSSRHVGLAEWSAKAKSTSYQRQAPSTTIPTKIIETNLLDCLLHHRGAALPGAILVRFDSIRRMVGTV